MLRAWQEDSTGTGMLFMFRPLPRTPLSSMPRPSDSSPSTLTLAKQLGAMVFTYKGEDIVDTLLRFAKEYRVGHIVIGSPTPRSLWEKVRGKTGVVDRLIHEAKGVTVTVLDTREEEQRQVQPSVESEEIPTAVPSGVEPVNRLSLPQLISPERVVIWNKPVEKEVVLKTLVEKLEERKGTWDAARFLNAILEAGTARLYLLQ